MFQKTRHDHARQRDARTEGWAFVQSRYERAELWKKRRSGKVAVDDGRHQSEKPQRYFQPNPDANTREFRQVKRGQKPDRNGENERDGGREKCRFDEGAEGDRWTVCNSRRSRERAQGTHRGDRDEATEEQNTEDSTKQKKWAHKGVRPGRTVTMRRFFGGRSGHGLGWDKVQAFRTTSRLLRGDDSRRTVCRIGVSGTVESYPIERSDIPAFPGSVDLFVEVFFARRRFEDRRFDQFEEVVRLVGVVGGDFR